MASLWNGIINYLQAYVIDKLLIVKGWRHQLAFLRENGSVIKGFKILGSEEKQNIAEAGASGVREMLQFPLILMNRLN